MMPSRQQGQAMIMSLILMAFALMVILFSFNVSQLNIKGTKLQNTADNTAYSVATLAARDMNFKAYTNRAAVANQVAVAQLVGLSSWFNMAEVFSQNACRVLCAVPYVGQVVNGIAQVVKGLNQGVQPAIKVLVNVENTVLKAISIAQQSMHYAGVTAAFDSAGDIVKANDPNARMDLMQNPLLIQDLKNVWVDFQTLQKRQNRNKGGSQYKDFIGVTLKSRDPFSNKRTYKLPFPWSFHFFPIKAKTYKAGGSELVSNGNRPESWTSMDTLSVHFSKFRCKRWRCKWRTRGIPAGWGGTVSDNRAILSRLNDRTYWGSSRGHNRSASNFAAADQVTRGSYDGVQPFYSLSNSAKGKSETSNILVVVSKKQDKVRTSNSVPLGGDIVDPATNEKMLGDRMTALAAAQVYYSRPRDLMKSGSAWARKDSKHEYGNLYNPFWQVRLSQSTQGERAAVQALTRLL
ncbi:Tad domain-containing protein [Shewanella algae]|uniref:Tad domain-containing protein n=1 Tax=Shewanella algae TaxID=38313 RepID=UPI003AAD2F5D